MSNHNLLISKYKAIIEHPDHPHLVADFINTVKQCNINVIMANSNLLWGEEQEGARLYRVIVSLFNIPTQELQRQKAKLEQFISFCDNRNAWKSESHRAELVDALTMINIKLSDNTFVYESINRILENYTNNSTLEINCEKILSEIDNCILQLSNEDNSSIEKICGVISKSRDKEFSFMVNSIIDKSFSIGIYGEETAVVDIDNIVDKVPNALSDRFKDMEYVDPLMVECIKKKIENERMMLKEQFRQHSYMIDKIATLLIESIDSISINVMESSFEIEDARTIEMRTMIEFALLGKEDTSDEFVMERLNNIISLSNAYSEIVTEGKVEKSLVRGAQKAEKGVTKATHSAKGVAVSTGNVVKAVGQIPKSLENEISNFINKMIEKDSTRRREELLNKGARVRLFKFIRKSLGVSITATLFGPLAAAIGYIGSIGVDKHLDAKERRAILRELDQELAIIDEKIDDAKAAGDNKQKYQLMRLKDKLENERKRVKFLLDK